MMTREITMRVLRIIAIAYIYIPTIAFGCSLQEKLDTFVLKKKTITTHRSFFQNVRHSIPKEHLEQYLSIVLDQSIEVLHIPGSVFGIGHIAIRIQSHVYDFSPLGFKKIPFIDYFKSVTAESHEIRGYLIQASLEEIQKAKMHAEARLKNTAFLNKTFQSALNNCAKYVHGCLMHGQKLSLMPFLRSEPLYIVAKSIHHSDFIGQYTYNRESSQDIMPLAYGIKVAFRSVIYIGLPIVIYHALIFL